MATEERQPRPFQHAQAEDMPAAAAHASSPLTPAEHEALSSDASDGGVGLPPKRNLELLRARARAHVEEAIRSIPAARKQAYLEALETAPEIVADESDPLLFVRVCDYNVWEAAERLLCYWRERKEIFGPERFCLPLNLTGEGALNHGDILSLRAGLYSILPGGEPQGGSSRENQQQDGAPLAVYCDRRQILQTASAQTRLKSCFYFVNLLAKDDRSQTTGAMLLVLLVTPRLMEYDVGFVRKGFWLSANAFPIKWNVHLLNCLPKTENKRYAVQEAITSYAGLVIDTYSKNCEVHIERYDGQIFEELTEMGFPPHGIPEAFGGSWTHYQFQQWCQQRIAEERQVLKLQQQLTPGSQSRKRRPAGAAAGSSSRRRTAEEKKTTNVLYSRRKRVRDKQELASLQEEKSKLTGEQEVLRAENQRLQDLIQESNDVLRELGLPSGLLCSKTSTTRSDSSPTGEDGSTGDREARRTRASTSRCCGQDPDHDSAGASESQHSTAV